jgi:hypothetical protein
MQVLATVRSESSAASYEIRRGGDGVVYCTCPSWRFSREARDCKHLRKLAVALSR